LAELGGASRGWLWLAGIAFAGALFCASATWRSAVCRRGGRLTRGQAVARYGVGSLVNSLAPTWAGEAVRIALFSRALDKPGAGWTSGGVLGAVAAARSVVVAGLLALAVVLGAFPVWPLAVLGSFAALAAAVCLATRRRRPRIPALSHLLEPFRALGCSPRAALPLLGWILASTACRVAGAAAVAAALGVSRPLVAGLLIVPAVDAAGLVPLLPANLGVTSGAVAVALESRGVGTTTALSTGLGLHAVELLVGLGVGLASALVLARGASSRLRLVGVPLAATGMLLLVGASLGATLDLDLG
jgi:uncharacterized membrane protein YbhN (UPF0104 family)